MQRNQWKTASEQLLKHWLSCGISHLPTHAPQSNSTATQWLTENAACVFQTSPAMDSPESAQETNAAPIALATFPDTRPLATASPETAPSVRERGPQVQPVAIAALNASPSQTARKSNTSIASPPAESLGTPGTWHSKTLDVSSRALQLHELNEQVKACRKCEDIVCRRQQTVFGVGATQARVVMFGEAPGADEDRVGEPFVGAAGQLLDKILAASGLHRPDVYILNALKCRPPNNRTPTELEIENCRPFFESQLEAIQPEYIVCWGAVAVRAVLRSTESVGRLRGKFHAFRGAKVMVTYHPAYLLRNPDAKRLTWDDMKMLIKEMGMQIPTKST